MGSVIKEPTAVGLDWRTHRRMRIGFLVALLVFSELVMQFGTGPGARPWTGAWIFALSYPFFAWYVARPLGRRASIAAGVGIAVIHGAAAVAFAAGASASQALIGAAMWSGIWQAGVVSLDTRSRSGKAFGPPGWQRYVWLRSSFIGATVGLSSFSFNVGREGPPDLKVTAGMYLLALPLFAWYVSRPVTLVGSTSVGWFMVASLTFTYWITGTHSLTSSTAGLPVGMAILMSAMVLFATTAVESRLRTGSWYGAFSQRATRIRQRVNFPPD